MMNTTLGMLQTQPQQGCSRSVTVPVSIPALEDVYVLAMRLHEIGQSYHDRAWGWEVTYESELSKAEAEVEVPDAKGGFAMQVMSLWMPASFTIGESGVWFFSLLWENGVNQTPVEFLDERGILESA